MDTSEKSFAFELAALIASSTNEYGIRSSKRTNNIHTFIKTYTETRNPRIQCIVEYCLDTGLGPFKVDIAFLARDTDKLLGVLLFKGLTSCILKNKRNYEHNKIGEAMKFKTRNIPSEKIVFLDVIPVRCPTYKSDGSVKVWEKHPPDVCRQRSINLQKETNKLGIIPIIDDIYSIFVEYVYESSKHISVSSIVDDSDLERFNQFIDGLLPV